MDKKTLKGKLKKVLNRLNIARADINKIINDFKHQEKEELLFKIQNQNVNKNYIIELLNGSTIKNIASDSPKAQITNKINSNTTVELQNNKSRFDNLNQIDLDRLKELEQISLLSDDDKKEIIRIKDRVRKRKKYLQSELISEKLISFRVSKKFDSLLTKEAKKLNITKSDLIKNSIAKELGIKLEEYHL